MEVDLAGRLEGFVQNIRNSRLSCFIASKAHTVALSRPWNCGELGDKIRVVCNRLKLKWIAEAFVAVARVKNLLKNETNHSDSRTILSERLVAMAMNLGWR